MLSAANSHFLHGIKRSGTAYRGTGLLIRSRAKCRAIGRELAQGVDLVVVLAIWERQHLRPQIIEPQGVFSAAPSRLPRLECSHACALDETFGAGAGARVILCCTGRGENRKITELVISLAGDVTGSAPLGELIHAAWPVAPGARVEWSSAHRFDGAACGRKRS